jgi:hypothetical protein
MLEKKQKQPQRLVVLAKAWREGRAKRVKSSNLIRSLLHNHDPASFCMFTILFAFPATSCSESLANRIICIISRAGYNDNYQMILFVA